MGAFDGKELNALLVSLGLPLATVAVSPDPQAEEAVGGETLKFVLDVCLGMSRYKVIGNRSSENCMEVSSGSRTEGWEISFVMPGGRWATMLLAGSDREEIGLIHPSYISEKTRAREHDSMVYSAIINVTLGDLSYGSALLKEVVGAGVC